MKAAKAQSALPTVLGLILTAKAAVFVVATKWLPKAAGLLNNVLAG